MLTENDIKEQLSYAYVHAVASRAGFACENVRKDRDSIDLHICARGRLHPESSVMSPLLAVQIKASVLAVSIEPTFEFRLSRKNYDELRTRTMVPRILVVFAMPESPDHWLETSEDALLMRRCAYSRSLLGAPPSENEKYQNVTMRRNLLFTVDTLTDWMVRASRQEAIENHG